MRLLERSFETAPRAEVRVSSEASIRIPGLDSEPQPDIAWLVRNDYSRVHPAPEDVFLLIEVCDTSLGNDRGTKLELYAEAKIRDYWIINIQNRSVEVDHDPQGSSFQSMTTFKTCQEVHTLAFPDISLDVSRLFPDRPSKPEPKPCGSSACSLR